MKKYDVEFEMRRLVTKQTRRYVQHGGRINQIATRAGVASTTVSKLAYGETKYPRFHTVVAVLDALGFSIKVEQVTFEVVSPTQGTLSTATKPALSVVK